MHFITFSYWFLFFVARGQICASRHYFPSRGGTVIEGREGTRAFHRHAKTFRGKPCQIFPTVSGEGFTSPVTHTHTQFEKVLKWAHTFWEKLSLSLYHSHTTVSGGSYEWLLGRRCVRLLLSVFCVTRDNVVLHCLSFCLPIGELNQERPLWLLSLWCVGFYEWMSK